MAGWEDGTVRNVLALEASPELMYKCWHGGSCLKSQSWGAGDRRVPDDCWPASLAELVNERPYQRRSVVFLRLTLKVALWFHAPMYPSPHIPVCTHITKNEIKSAPIILPVVMGSSHVSTLQSTVRASPFSSTLDSSALVTMMSQHPGDS